MNNLTTEQFNIFLAAVIKVIDRPYTITGASDWPILVAVAAILALVIGWLAVIMGRMWDDLRETIKEGRKEWRDDLDKYKTEHEKEHDRIWQAHRDCQVDCCKGERK